MAALGTVLRSVRRLHCSAAAGAGSKWRLQQGLAANPSGYGPLTEHPDWSYADGRPAPPMKGQLRRRAQREQFAVSETRRPAVTGNGCWHAGMEAQAAGDAAGRRKEAGKRPQTQRETTPEPHATPVKKQLLASILCAAVPLSLAFSAATFSTSREPSLFPVCLQSRRA
ncbi:large ribosomal subunit protein mL52 isoform X6 [Sorex fumeus]|uniref:large ribosomal subunit protein mL52 isoform X6 n=1 Tax=Sorex fumeus TaxID=62283 RepID=UPI0024ACE999|nr:large ribosomal subunit protein mL52 isoform X6 [Sorex fumeus]